MLKRLLLFFFGLFLGVIFLFFFFSQKRAEFCYLPNCRVLKDIRKKPMSIGSEFSFLSLSDISPILHRGDIDFSKSDTQSTPCRTYIVSGLSKSGQRMTLTIENCPEGCRLTKVQIQGD